MKSDPIVEEVRKARQAHAAKYGYQLSTICAALREKEKTCGHPVVSHAPKRLQKTTKNEREGGSD